MSIDDAPPGDHQVAVDPDAADPAVDGLAVLAFELISRLARIAAEHDLSLTHLRMLGILRDRRPRMAELASALGIDRSSVSGLIARAEQRGLVTRSNAAGDGRGVTVELTDAGRTLTGRLTQRGSQVIEELLAAFTIEERAALEALLAKIDYT